MRKPYASDISREKFEEILPLLQSVRKRTTRVHQFVTQAFDIVEAAL